MSTNVYICGHGHDFVPSGISKPPPLPPGLNGGAFYQFYPPPKVVRRAGYLRCQRALLIKEHKQNIFFAVLIVKAVIAETWSEFWIVGQFVDVRFAPESGYNQG